MSDGRALVLPFPSESSAELLIGSVLATLTSQKTKQAYATALADFLSWTAARGELSKPLVEAWRGDLLARGLSVSSVNQRSSAVRLLFRQAAERGALSAEEALRLASVPNVKQGGQRLGKWLTEGEAGKPKSASNNFREIRHDDSEISMASLTWRIIGRRDG